MPLFYFTVELKSGDLNENDWVRITRGRCDKEMFRILVERYFPLAVGKKTWKLTSKSASVARRITAEFEAMTIVCMHNTWDRVCWDHRRNILPEDEKPPMTQRPGTKYTNTNGMGSNGEGWTEEGKEFFAKKVLPHVTLGRHMFGGEWDIWYKGELEKERALTAEAEQEKINAAIRKALEKKRARGKRSLSAKDFRSSNAGAFFLTVDGGRPTAEEARKLLLGGFGSSASEESSKRQRNLVLDGDDLMAMKRAAIPQNANKENGNDGNGRFVDSELVNSMFV